MASVLNVRIAQLDISNGVLRLPRQSLRSAVEAAGHEVLLFASRDDGGSSYFATAQLGEALPDPASEKMYLLPLHDQQPFSRAVSLKELHALGVHEMPFHIYHFPIRQVPEDEHSALVDIGVIPAGFGEEATHRFDGIPTDNQRRRTADYRALRFEMLELYGPRCAFLRRSFPNLNESRFGIDVGHVWPHWAGGPDIIQNVLPMSKDVNNQ